MTPKITLAGLIVCPIMQSALSPAAMATGLMTTPLSVYSTPSNDKFICASSEEQADTQAAAERSTAALSSLTSQSLDAASFNSNLTA